MPNPAQKATAPATKPKRVSVAAVRNRAENLSEEFLHCRDNGHTWNMYRLLRVKGGFERSFWCKSCKTAKHQFVSRSGRVLAMNYIYQDGYQLPGIGRLYGDHRAALRVAHLNRLIERAESEGQGRETEAGFLIVEEDPETSP